MGVAAIDFSKFCKWAPSQIPLNEPPEYIMTALDLVNMDVECIPTLYEGLMPSVGLWSLVGSSDTGKSMILRQLALSVVGGHDFLDRKFKGVHKKAIIASSEDDDLALAFLLKKQNQTMQLSNSELSNLRVICETDELVEKLRKELERQRVDLIICDAFGDLFSGKDLNQNNQVRTFLNSFSQLANKYKCSICFLHHTGKRTEDLAPSKNNSIGSQGYEAKMRLLLELRRDKVDPEIRHLCVVKGNYLPDTEKAASYVLRMDENFCFSTTGSRVAFDELKADNGKDSKKTKPSQFNSQEHYSFLTSIYPDKNTTFSTNRLKEEIMTHFDISDKPAREFVRYYERCNWIKDISFNQRICEYKLVEGFDLF